MTKVKIFEELIAKAKANGYTGPDYNYELGFIVNGTNFYSVIFREDFAQAIWGERDDWERGASMRHHLVEMVKSEDKWKYLEENALLFKYFSKGFIRIHVFHIAGSIN